MDHGGLLPLAMATATLDAQETSTWRWNGTLADGRTVYMHNVNGNVRFEVGSGDRVEVEARSAGVAVTRTTCGSRRGKPAAATS